MKLKNRSGEKFRGNTALIPAAATIADIAAKCSSVSTICSNTIMLSPRRSRNGSRQHVKIIDEDLHKIILLVTDGSANQELRIYTSDLQVTKLCIAREARNNKFTISFGTRQTTTF